MNNQEGTVFFFHHLLCDKVHIQQWWNGPFLLLPLYLHTNSCSWYCIEKLLWLYFRLETGRRQYIHYRGLNNSEVIFTRVFFSEQDSSWTSSTLNCSPPCNVRYKVLQSLKVQVTFHFRDLPFARVIMWCGITQFMLLFHMHKSIAFQYLEQHSKKRNAYLFSDYKFV